MKIIVVGLGSMGRRRIRLMKQLNADVEICGIDANRQRMEAVQEEFGIVCKPSIKEAVLEGRVDGAFVCTSPLSHHVIIKEILGYGISVFTEINLVSDGYEEILKIRDMKKVKLFLSSTFLYRNDIQHIVKKTKNEKVNYMYHTGQYLPDWHPWESYKDFFVADKRTNGCREILTIELPWIIECFGAITDVKTVKDNLSQLNLDYCDNYLLMLQHENGNKGCIAVDVVARKARRSLEVFGENIQLFWNGTPDSLMEFNIAEKKLESITTYNDIEKDSRYCDNIIENAYMDEVVAFFDWIQNDTARMVRYNFEKDYDVLKWIDFIEK